MSRRDWQFSVFPRPDVVMALGGYRVSTLEAALWCWLEALTQASTDLQQRFDKADFHFLFEALHDAVIEAGVVIPSEQMAQAVERAGKRPGLAFAVFNDETGQRVEKLARKVRQLDYLHAWAIIWPHRCFRENCAGLDPMRVEWWKIEFVKAHAHPRGERSKQPT